MLFRSYNNATGSKFINVTPPFIKENFPKCPQIYLGGTDNSTSVKIIDNMVFNKDVVGIEGSKANNTNILSRVGAKGFYDLEGNYSGVNVMSIQNFEFNSENNVNVSSISYETRNKVLVKSLGNLLFISGKLAFSVEDTTANVKLYYPEEIEWLKGCQSTHEYATYRPLTIPLVCRIGGVEKIIYARLYRNNIELIAPEGGWGSSNGLNLNFTMYREDRE